MKINYNAPFWKLMKQVRYYLALIVFLLAVICLVSITIVTGIDNNSSYQERVYQEHSAVWEVE